MVAKGEIAHDEVFLLLSQVFNYIIYNTLCISSDADLSQVFNYIIYNTLCISSDADLSQVFNFIIYNTYGPLHEKTGDIDNIFDFGLFTFSYTLTCLVLFDIYVD